MALGDLDETRLDALIRHGEDLLVERKQAMPAEPGFGAAVASLANTLGGWILLGVDDEGEVVGWQPKGGADIQSHLGQLLRNQVDPLPAFVAATREVRERSIGVVRVFPSSDTPHIVRPTGAVYVRDSGGKQHIKEASDLLALARRGDEATRQASDRLVSLRILHDAVTPEEWATWSGTLKSGDVPPVDHLTLIARAGPVTVTPQFNDWAVSRGAASAAETGARGIAERLGVGGTFSLDPRGRGCIARRVGPVNKGEVRVDFAIDPGGAIAARIRREARDGPRNRAQFQSDLMALVFAIDDCLMSAEAYGRTVWRVDILMPEKLGLSDARRNPLSFFASSELTIPVETNELGQMYERWIREYYREAGVADWES